MKKDKKPLPSWCRVALVFLIALGLFGAYCFIHFAYQASQAG
jgi:hypothetical protein